MNASTLARHSRRALDFSLPGVMVGTYLFVIAGSPAGAWLARPALLAYLAVQWPRLPRIARILLIISACLALGVLGFHDDGVALSLRALDSACFLATFVTSLSMLRVAAQHSRLVREAGAALIQQKPTWRYPILSLGTALFGIIINVGVLGLFGAMAQRSNSLKAAHGHVEIQQARERRMMMAILRGFALAPVVSPLGVTMAVVLASMPYLRWADLAPAAIPVGILFFLVGWLLDYLQRPRQLAVLMPTDKPSASLAPLGRFTLLAGLVTASVFLIGALFDLRLPVAVLVACPLSAWVWLAMQRRRLGGGIGFGRACGTLVRHSRLIFGANRNEVAMLGGSAFAGVVITALIDQQALAQWLLASGLHGVLAAVVAMFLVLLLAQFGINPLVSVTLAASLFPDTRVIGLEPVVLACALMSAWTLAVISSPFTASLTILSDMIKRSPYEVAWRWNGVFFVLMLPLVTLWLYGLQYWLTR